MSKFLKAIVNTILLLAILVAGGLLIPPLAGVTTVVVDDMYMNTNLEQGSVTYAMSPKEGFKKGDEVLISEDGKQYVYTILGIQDETYTLEDTLSVDNTTEERTLGANAKKVLFTIPFMGYVSMALGTTEGLIIVGLGILFAIILFILSEVWKHEDDEEADDDEEDDDNDEEDDSEEVVLSKRQQKKAAKKAAKQEKADKKAAKKARKTGTVQEEVSEENQENQNDYNGQEEPTQEEKELFAETSDTLAANLAMMIEEDKTEPQPEEETAAESIANGDTIVIPMDTEKEVTEEAAVEGTEEDPEEEITAEETEENLEEEPVTEEAEENSEEESVTEEAEKNLEEEPVTEEAEENSEEEPVTEEAEENSEEEPVTEEAEENSEEESVTKETEERSKEEPKVRHLAMPIYTKDELERVIREEGDQPKVVEDKVSGITLFDYSDIL